MNLKIPSSCLLIILVALQLISCTNTSPTPPSTLTPTATPVPPQTPTPRSTATNTASPTPETQLHGLITELENIPTYTAEQRQAAIQLAIDSTSLTQETAGIWITQVSQVAYRDDTLNSDIADTVRITCALDKSCLIRDTFQMMIQTPQGEKPAHYVLMEYFVTFEDGTQGPVVVPIIIDQKGSDPTQDPDRETEYLLQLLQKSDDSSGGVIDFLRIITSTRSNFPQPINPVISALIESAMNDQAARALLEKAHTLAGEGKFLSQDEINTLWGAIIKY